MRSWPYRPHREYQGTARTLTAHPAAAVQRIGKTDGAQRRGRQHERGTDRACVAVESSHRPIHLG